MGFTTCDWCYLCWGALCLKTEASPKFNRRYDCADVNFTCNASKHRYAGSLVRQHVRKGKIHASFYRINKSIKYASRESINIKTWQENSADSVAKRRAESLRQLHRWSGDGGGDSAIGGGCLD
jgi:hypothetical protein